MAERVTAGNVGFRPTKIAEEGTTKVPYAGGCIRAPVRAVVGGTVSGAVALGVRPGVDGSPGSAALLRHHNEIEHSPIRQIGEVAAIGVPVISWYGPLEATKRELGELLVSESQAL